MIRVTRMSGTFYGIDTDIWDDDEIENIEGFVLEGTPVILVESLEDLEALDIDPDDVQMVTRD